MSKRRLFNELEMMHQLKRESSMIDFYSEGSPPERYLVQFTCKGVAELRDGQPVISENHIVQIYLPADYPDVPPEVKFLTPIWHPNIASVLQNSASQRKILEMIDRAQSQQERDEIIHAVRNDPSLRQANVCLDVLDANWRDSFTLRDVCIRLGEMIQYKSAGYRANHPLNNDAAEWAENNKDLFPIDKRKLLDQQDVASIEITVLEVSDADLIRTLHTGEDE